MSKHLVFYDGECGFCDAIVQLLLQWDKKELFLFAPLQGETAKKLLRELPEEVKTADSLILVTNYRSENEEILLFGKAALRILWLLGGLWKALGWISFLPGFLYNWVYRIVARNRHRLMSQACIVPDPTHKERFLP